MLLRTTGLGLTAVLVDTGKVSLEAKPFWHVVYAHNAASSFPSHYLMTISAIEYAGICKSKHAKDVTCSLLLQGLSDVSISGVM